MKEDAVTHILKTGTELISKKGFHHVGLQEILAEAAIPKGSFYYYFKSKEDFGIKVIEYYSKTSLEFLHAYLRDSARTPKERILSLFHDLKSVYHSKDYREGCLLGNCSLELSDVKPTYAAVIAGELDKWQDSFEVCIRQGQEEGSVQNRKEAKKLAAFILNSWEGALLRMKADKSAYHFDLFVDFVEELL